MSGEYLWWQRGIIYQIYPRSFMDSNGDGIGDLRGITSKLDYLKWLGVDAIWISPIFPSPMADFGYDVSNYIDIHPMFGSLADFDELLAAAHARGLKVLLDFVPNHTSDQHPWFIESRAARDNAKRDWYIWHDPAPDGGPPNNWLSVFGGSGWELDRQTGQYYYHAFLKEQPDLNWRNPEVQEAMLGALRFWLDRGVDGFRVDVIWHMIKDDQFRDNPINPEWKEGDYPYQKYLPVFTADRPEVHDIIAKMRAVLDQYLERMMVGEIYLPLEQLMKYYGEGKGAHLPFNFQLVELPWSAGVIANAIDAYESALPMTGWPNWVLGNHDRPRIATRVGSAQARVAAMLLLTLRGTPTLYYGDEIGMENVPIAHELAHDPLEKNIPGSGRDPERTPMQWNSELNAGFTSGQPWLPIADNYQTVNVEQQRNASDSMLTLHRRLIALRRAEPALNIGSHRSLPATGHLIAYIRNHADKSFLIVLNLGTHNEQLANKLAGKIVLSTLLDREGEKIPGAIELRGDEGLVIELD